MSTIRNTALESDNCPKVIIGSLLRLSAFSLFLATAPQFWISGLEDLKEGLFSLS